MMRIRREAPRLDYSRLKVCNISPGKQRTWDTQEPSAASVVKDKSRSLGLAKLMTRIKLIGSMAIAFAFSAGPANAAGTISCQSVDAEPPAAVEITVGQLPALVPVSVRVLIGEQVWNTLDSGDGVTLALMQAFDFGQGLLIDLADPNVERVLFRIRLFREEEARDLAVAGTLGAAGIGAFALVCQGP
jgi:hypothetical protein